MNISDEDLCAAITGACGENDGPEKRLNVIEVTSDSWAEKRAKVSVAVISIIEDNSGQTITLSDVITRPINSVWTNVSDGRFKSFLVELEARLGIPKFSLNRSVFVRAIKFSFLIGQVTGRI